MINLLDVYEFIIFSLSLIISLSIINMCVVRLQAGPKCIVQPFGVYVYRITIWCVAVSAAHTFFITLTKLHASEILLLKEATILILLASLARSKLGEEIRSYINHTKCSRFENENKSNQH